LWQPAGLPAQRLELKFPLLEPVRFSFSAASAPGYEMWRLPTYELDGIWFEKGAFSLHSIGRAAPAFELDCTLLCQPVLEQSMALEPRLAVGSFGPHVPATWITLRAEHTQWMSVARGSSAQARGANVIRAAVGGLLDF
jgi:hypothetical protein